MTVVDRTHIDAFRRDGFVGIDPLVDADALDTVRVACDEVLTRAVTADGDRLLGGTIRQVVLPHQSHPTFDDNPVLDTVLAVARELLGTESVVRVFDQIIHKPAGDTNVTPWHQDHSYIASPFAPAGSAISPNAAMFWVALDDVDVDNSCMQFLPGRHHEPLLPHHVAAGDHDDDARLLAIVDPERHLDLADAVPVPLHAGGCTVHHAGTPHMTTGNITRDRDRRAYIVAVFGF